MGERGGIFKVLCDVKRSQETFSFEIETYITIKWKKNITVNLYYTKMGKSWILYQLLVFVHIYKLLHIFKVICSLNYKSCDRTLKTKVFYTSFRSFLVKNINVVSLSWSLVAEPIWVCRTQWWCSLFSVFNPAFLGKFGPKNQIC